MEVALLAVGRLRPYYREACDDYLRRLARYVRITERDVREAARAPTPMAQQADEAEALQRHLPSGGTIVALARDGRAWSSADLATHLDRWLLEARPLVFVLGGSHGLHSAFVGRAQAVWSLGPLTLPHELARVVVTEQLYRAFTILRGEPYHKGR